MPEPIRVAILGLGRSGRNIHGACLSKLDGYKIAAVCDIDANRRERAIKEYGCEAVEKYSDLYGRNDIDLVINALPSQLHAPVTLEFLRRGQAVQTEKPAAATVREIDQLLLTAKSTGAGLYFFQNSRFLPWFMAAREILDSGVLGRVVQIKLWSNGFGRRWDWQTIQSNNAGSLRNTGPHPMDHAVVLMNTNAMPEIFCHFDRVNTWGDAEDFAKVIMRVQNGPVVDLEISCCDFYPETQMIVQAQYGTLKATAEKVTYKYYDTKTAPPQKLVHKPIENENGEPAYCREKLDVYEKSIDVGEGTVVIGGQPSNAAVVTLYRKLYAHIREGADYEITGRQVRQQIMITDECHKIFPMSTL